MSRTSTVWLGLGANLGDPCSQLRDAVCDLERHPDFDEVCRSGVWHGPYLGPRGPQPEYFNLCVRLRTSLAPREVLEICRDLELAAGRAQDTHEQPRVLDIDLLLFDTLCLEEPGLTLPHPRMRERRFVLQPLLELDEDLELPPDSVRVVDLLGDAAVANQELEVVDESGVRPEPVPGSQV
jgi:2-amino-4-hydroxy-6-hydroxymethyldihydropteridine diphosphokinase